MTPLPRPSMLGCPCPAGTSTAGLGTGTCWGSCQSGVSKHSTEGPNGEPRRKTFGNRERREEWGGRTEWLSWAQGSFLVPISNPEMDPLAPSRGSCPCSAASAHLAARSLLYPALGTTLSLVVDFVQTGLHFSFFFPINSSVFRHASKIPRGF